MNTKRHDCELYIQHFYRRDLVLRTHFYIPIDRTDQRYSVHSVSNRHQFGIEFLVYKYCFDRIGTQRKWNCRDKSIDKFLVSKVDRRYIHDLLYKLLNKLRLGKWFPMDIDCQLNNIELEHSPTVDYLCYLVHMSKCQHDFPQRSLRVRHMHSVLSMGLRISNPNMISSVGSLCFHCIQLIYIRRLDHHVNSMDICRMHDEHLLYIVHFDRKQLVNRMDFCILNQDKRPYLDNRNSLNILLDFCSRCPLDHQLNHLDKRKRSFLDNSYIRLNCDMVGQRIRLYLHIYR